MNLVAFTVEKEKENKNMHVIRRFASKKTPNFYSKSFFVSIRFNQ